MGWLNLEIDDTLHARLKYYATIERVNLRDLIKTILGEGVDKRDTEMGDIKDATDVT